ncbi:MAG: hypothetical protein LBV17_09920 [Treponema sp.]|jgi:hypothetical protein|nr:hypothetical protein [Treponema sp.]
MATKNKFLCPHCGKEINAAAMLGARTSEKKAASSAENGKKGGRPKITTMTGLEVNAMKNGELHILMLVPMHVTGRGEKAKYKLVVCYPGGTQADAEYQPVNDGSFPDIELLAEKNGFETVDIRAFNRPF